MNSSFLKGRRRRSVVTTSRRLTGSRRWTAYHWSGVLIALVLAWASLPVGAFAQKPETARVTQTTNVDQGSTAPDADADPKAPNSTAPFEIFKKIHWVFIAPFLIASVIALWFSIERLVMLRQGRVIPRPFVERFLEHLEQGKLEPEKALELCEKNGSPLAYVFAHGVRKWGKSSVEVEQAIIDGGERQVSRLRKHLRVLNGVATVTPLMGLLGTVIGMIGAFNAIGAAGAMGTPEKLAIDIGVALLTTAFGLMIAIPALIMYMYLAGRVDALVMEMDALAQELVDLISAEALVNRPFPAAQPKGRRTRTKPAPEQKEKRAV